MADVKVRLKPLKSIGGVGNPGDVVTMSEEDAKRYVEEGYVEIVEDSDQTPAPQGEHVIMKPQSKRRK